MLSLHNNCYLIALSAKKVSFGTQTFSPCWPLVPAGCMLASTSLDLSRGGERTVQLGENELFEQKAGFANEDDGSR
jgi:hypothetical protein